MNYKMLQVLSTRFKKEMSINLLVNVDLREWYATGRPPTKDLKGLEKSINGVFKDIVKASSGEQLKKIEDMANTLRVACWASMNVPFPVSSEAHALRVFENLCTLFDELVRECEEPVTEPMDVEESPKD